MTYEIVYDFGFVIFYILQNYGDANNTKEGILCETSSNTKRLGEALTNSGKAFDIACNKPKGRT